MYALKQTLNKSAQNNGMAGLAPGWLAGQAGQAGRFGLRNVSSLRALYGREKEG